MSLGWLVTGMLVAARLAGTIMIMPVLSVQGIQPLVRLMLGISLAVVITPVLPIVDTPPTITNLTVDVMSELLIGVLIGGVVRLVFATLSVAGELISTQVGHGAAMFFDPVSASAHGPLGHLAIYLSSAIFLGTNLHLKLLLNVSESFTRIPPGASVDIISAGGVWLGFGQLILQSGIQIASPFICLIFLINLFVAIITRLAPQMNVFFALGLILTVSGGETLFFIGLPELLNVVLQLIDHSLNQIPAVIDQLTLPMP